jgi:hypothetical protein
MEEREEQKVARQARITYIAVYLTIFPALIGFATSLVALYRSHWQLTDDDKIVIGLTLGWFLLGLAFVYWWSCRHPPRGAALFIPNRALC